MKVIHIQKKHIKRLVLGFIIFSIGLSYYLHLPSDDEVEVKAEKKSDRSSKVNKHKKPHKHHNLGADSNDNPQEKDEDVEVVVPVNEILGQEPEQNEPDLEHNEAQIETNQIKKWRLEELDVEHYTEAPFLGDGPGNYENRPPIPPVGSAGHDVDNTGEGGLKGIVLNAEEQKKVTGALRDWGFNMVASDKVNMDRIPADLRMDECKRWNYPQKMAAVSVVLVFHNEGFSTLLRTVHSVVNYSPPELLQEVVMLNDGSTREYITNGTIDRYIERWNGLVKIYHNDKREGLIRARTIGGKHATGSILVYLDAHCEVEPNWLPPLIAPIMQNRKVSTVPMVDSISGSTYIFEPQQGGDENNLARGAWDWNFDWKRIPLNAREKARRKTVTEPYRSPAMAGGLFAISKDWFEELGWYDEHLEIWGGENFELSYKLWQCGGQLLFVPCSRVGHIYRMPGWGGNGTPDDLKGKNFIAINYNRVIETWWDDNYKKYYYARRPGNKDVDPGDLTAVLAVKEKLQCKDFSWFMKEIAYDIPKYWPMTKPEDIATGVLRNVGTKLCPAHYPVEQGKPVALTDDCTNEYTLTWHEEITSYKIFKKQCWDDRMGAQQLISFWECHKGYGNQLYKWWKDSQQIYHPASRKCVTAVAKEGEVGMGNIVFETCDAQNENQKWEWPTTNEAPWKRAMTNKDKPGLDPPELDYIS